LDALDLVEAALGGVGELDEFVEMGEGEAFPHYQQSCPPCPTDPPGGQP
jgi:hypothetical protein